MLSRLITILGGRTPVRFDDMLRAGVGSLLGLALAGVAARALSGPCRGSRRSLQAGGFSTR